MPKAAMYQHRQAMLRQNKIRRARKIAAMNPEAKPKRMRQPPHRQLRLGVRLTNSTHVSATLSGVKLIGRHFEHP